ncbi:unnamed protein product [Candidula unifasciata]|uniref:Uncharacterized protein n=1 Tax=Candidula unifasciata TaxID=100452 RepID=A0A8S3ZAJ0_9EUPU|nr:unnamed protein product [Candidula unifasciata]
MERRKGTVAKNRNVFKGTVLISLLVETNASFFPSRITACKFARRLFREGHIQSISGAKDFEDSAQLYVWCDLERPEAEHGHILISAGSSYRQISWQLIQDIRSKLLNRSETYNIVTSYNTFFQELEHDFGFVPKPGSNTKSQPGHREGWSQSNTPHTSTLENRKDVVHSTDSSLENQAYQGRLRDNKTKRKNCKLPAGNSSSVDNKISSSVTVPHETLHLNHPQQDRKSFQQKHHLQHNSPALHQNIPEVNREQASRMNTEHNLVSDERLISTNENSQHQLSLSDVTSMNHRDAPYQQAAMLSHNKSVKSLDNLENAKIRHSEPVLNRDNDRRTTEQFNHNQTQAFPPEMQSWLDPGVSHFSGNQLRVPKNNRPEDDSSQSNGSRTKWAESSVNDGMDNGRRWPESAYSYSDNEKQLLEEMRRMKKEHQNVLRTYESRINKLMAKMHELRNIAEMLEHSSNKSSPYGILPGKLAILNILEGKTVDGKNVVTDSTNSESDRVPPPLPPRPGKGSRVYPNKPIIRTDVTMKSLPWSRIILESNGGKQSNTIWHGMTEPRIDTEELQRLFSECREISEVNLYDDICLRRGGRNQTQLVSIYDAERSQRIVSELRSLHCTLTDITQVFMTLNCDGLHTDSFAELLELLKSQRDLDQISHHTKKRGAGQLDAPEFLISELSKIDHFRERLEFLRFKNKIQINLFEIDQQLRELHTACEEITSSVPLRHVLETVLAIGNHMNAGTDRGQADGFHLDVLASLKDVQDMSKQNSLLELAMRQYCLRFESDLAFGCPTRFRLPEPSNMRHAAQVSFEDIQRALKELKNELSVVRNKLETLSKREGNTVTVTLRAISEHFLSSAMEVLAEEQKLLDDTRVQFWKTAAFFSYDGQKSTPQEFFQIWASFLHDCKYYWKLAHRNLAKAKFNADLSSKSQLSCSSVPGFNSLRSAMMKHVAVFQEDEEMRTCKAQQLQHINSWIQSVGKYTLEMQSEGASSSLDKDYIGQQLVPQERKHQQPHLQESELNHSSPPYQNETFAEPRNNKAVTNLGRQLEQEDKPVPDLRAVQQNKIGRNDTDIPQAPSSPKPINATPPDVLRPRATIHPALKQQANSATSSEFHIARPMMMFQANSPGMQSHRKNSGSYPDDNFGFEPLYESLSHYSRNYHNPEMNEESSCPQDGVQGLTSSGSTLTDHDNIQKKNSNFFKSLLKRDQIRGPLHEEHSQVSPHRNVSTPFRKVKHTFAQKFSANGNAKNSNSVSPKNYPISHQNMGNEIPSKPQTRASSKPDSYYMTDKSAFNNVTDVKERDSVDYQNICFPDQPRKEVLNHADTPDSLEVHPDRSERIFYRDGHESFPSTISSLQSVRGRSRPFFQENAFYRRDVALGSHDAFHKGPNEEAIVSDKGPTNSSENRTEPTNQSRMRAPIAIGSNMSISEAYAKGAEHDQTQMSGNHDFQPPQSAFSEVNQEKITVINDRNSSDPKWIKASLVPVYKAKVIPNYENQSKYDPRFEGGVRGQATGMIQHVHVPQVSISSDVYRQELQKKSEQYLGGGIYPTLSLTSGGSGSLRGSGSTGASYTILPPKSNHYQALPITLPQNTQKAPENNSHMYPQSSNNTMPETSQLKVSNQTYGHRNNPENGEAVSTSDYSPKDLRHNIEGTKSNSRRKSEVAKGQSLPVDAGKGRTAFVNNIPVYRSSSAHSILDRDNEFRKEDRKFHSAYARTESQPEAEGHISRKDTAGKKTTATTHRAQSPVRGEAPKSVTSLIDKFEKGTDLNNPGIGLLDISDKPPSMTSTPVVKRRNQGVSTPQPSHGKLAASKSADESHRSQSEEPKQFHNQKEFNNMPGWPNSKILQNQPGTVHASLDRHISNSHQIMATHYTQSYNEEGRKTPHDQILSNHVQHFHQNSNNQKTSQPFTNKPKLQQSQHTVSETPHQHYREQYLESDSASEQTQSQIIISPGYDKAPNWYQQRHSQQVTHNSRFQPPHPAVQPYNSFPTNSNINAASHGTSESLRCNEDFYQSTKVTTSSAFENPLRVATKYGRQPGAMAVVKPTVMNI